MEEILNGSEVDCGMKHEEGRNAKRNVPYVRTMLQSRAALKAIVRREGSGIGRIYIVCDRVEL